MNPPVPLHPMVVHFPIALVILWPIIDTAGLVLGRKDLTLAGLALLVAAVFASIAATVTGQSSFDAAVQLKVDPGLLNTHADDANLIPWMLLTILVVRSAGVLKFGKRGHVLSIALGFSMWIVIFAVGESGGALVYEHGIGVRRVGSGAESPEIRRSTPP